MVVLLSINPMKRNPLQTEGNEAKFYQWRFNKGQLKRCGCKNQEKKRQ